jgi:hypothetical protein
MRLIALFPSYFIEHNPVLTVAIIDLQTVYTTLHFRLKPTDGSQAKSARKGVENIR